MWNAAETVVCSGLVLGNNVRLHKYDGNDKFMKTQEKNISIEVRSSAYFKNRFQLEKIYFQHMPRVEKLNLYRCSTWTAARNMFTLEPIKSVPNNLGKELPRCTLVCAHFYFTKWNLDVAYEGEEVAEEPRANSKYQVVRKSWNLVLREKFVCVDVFIFMKWNLNVADDVGEGEVDQAQSGEGEAGANDEVVRKS